MQTNILQAIANIVNNHIYELKTYYQVRNRANSMGEALEEYIKDIFANTLLEENGNIRLKVLEKTFSYLGNKNNPPDIMIRNGDAIEIKKIESLNSTIALNSSYPKAKLFAHSNMITEQCRNCEKWTEKDIIYTIGVVPKENALEGKSLASLFLVYGIDYAASANIYERIKNIISEGIESINDVEFATSNELSRVNKVDPLGITHLRIRGMWGIENPLKTFSYLLPSQTTKKFQLLAIINNDKYNSFSQKNRLDFENLVIEHKDFNITDVEIKSPDNPSILKKAKLITFFYN